MLGNTSNELIFLIIFWIVYPHLMIFEPHLSHSVIWKGFGVFKSSEIPSEKLQCVKASIIKISKMWGSLRDALGDVGGSFLIDFKGLSENLEKMKIPWGRTIRIYQDTFKICLNTRNIHI